MYGRVIDKTYKYPYKRYNLLFAITANKIHISSLKIYKN